MSRTRTARGSLLRPRLLPATIVGLAALLAVKSVGLVGAAYGAGEPAPPVPQASPPPPPPPGAGAVPPAALASPPASAAMPPQQVVAAATPPAEAMPSAAERSLLLDLRKRRLELDAKTAALDQREMLMGAVEKRFAARADELAALQKRLEALETARRDRDETSWRGLVRVYETMKPKDAAAIFNDLDSSVLLQVVDRMKDGKTAAVLAAMTPDRARRLTADLSALRSRANAPPEAAIPIQPAASHAPPDPAANPLHPAGASPAGGSPVSAPPGASP